MKAVTAARRGALDTVTYATPYSNPLRRGGSRTFFRYLNPHKHFRDTPDTSGDWFISLSTQELEELLRDDLDVGIVQRGIGKRNRGGTDAGDQVGEAAAHNASGLKLPSGIHVFCDCEWSESYVPGKDEQIAYIEAWARPVNSAGFIASLYVSPDLLLNSKELYALAGIRAYWKAASHVPAVDIRGYQVVQSLEYWYDVADDCWYSWDKKYYGRKGIRHDLDMVCADGLANEYGRGGRLKVIGS